MKNLLEALKPEIKQELERSAIKHPDTVQGIYELLERTSRYSELTICELGTLYTFADVSLVQTSIWDFRYGDNLFYEF